jgi:hypothetical protein
MSSRRLDTSPASWSRYESVLDRMDGPARVHAAAELSDAVREIRLAGVRPRHPEVTRAGAVVRLVAEDYGVTLPGSE